MAQQKFRFQVPKDFGVGEREEFADTVIDFIVARTQAGQDKSNSKFKKYTKAYAKKKGVSRGSVDLTLQGDMLDAMKLLTHRSGSITIGYDKGTLQNAKAEGNQKVHGRKFLGVNESDLIDLIDLFEDE